MAPDQPAAAETALQVNRVFHDHECAYYDERFAVRHDRRDARRARREVEAVLGRRLSAGWLTVDVGCGTGWLAGGLRRSGLAPAVGVDLSAGMLGRARLAGAWPLVQADVGRLPFPDGSVDLLVARGVLHHLADPTAALTEWRRVLRPAGQAVLTSEPTAAVERHGAALVRLLLPLLHRPLSPEEDFWEVAAMAANLHVFSASGLHRAATAAGFRRVRVSSHGLAGTLTLTACYLTYGRRPALARRLPWRQLEAAGRLLDRWLFDRLVPPGRRHTLTALLAN